MRIFFCLSMFVFAHIAQALTSYEMAVEVYIEQYKEAAVDEMHRTGIPASIKLAQGILESNAGRSELAIHANNHFGMKCGGQWEGPTYFKKDDDRDRRGRLIESCFRVFQSPKESYVEHSRFLMDPKKQYRYGFLFEIEKTDYKSWAWGLKRAGYATNKKYAVLLIDIIEKFGLFTYDYHAPSNIKYVDPAEAIARNRKILTEQPKMLETNMARARPQVNTETLVQKATVEFYKERRITEVNKVSFVASVPGETLEIIGRLYDVDVERLVAFNEGMYERGKILEPGSKVFLETKRRNFSGPAHYHTVQRNESLFEISQNYGLRLDALQMRNRIDEREVPKAGERIKLKGGTVDVEQKPMVMLSVAATQEQTIVPTENNEKTPDVSPVKDPFLKMQSESTLATLEENEKTPQSKIQESKLSNRSVSQQSAIPVKTFHLVSKGDTLYSLGKKYQISPEKLKAMNGLEDNNIRMGEKLRVK